MKIEMLSIVSILNQKLYEKKNKQRKQMIEI